MAADDRDNIFNEISNKFSHLIQIDQHINRVIQECNQSGRDILIRLVETLREDHEDVMNRLHDYLVVFCSPNNIGDTQNLEVFQMEREVNRVMGEKPEPHLASLMRVLEGLSTEEDEIIENINDLVEQFDLARIPKNVADFAEESSRREQRLRDFAASIEVEGVNVHFTEDERKIIKDMIKEHAEAKKVWLKGEGSSIDQSGDSQFLEGGDAQEILSNAITVMYGFRPSVVNKITIFVESRKIINKTSKNQEKGIKLEVELGSFPVFSVLKPEASGALDWEIVGILREKFEALQKKILDEVERFPKKGSKGIPKCSDLSYERHEILKVVKSWVFRLECNFCQLLSNLHAMVLGCEAAVIKFEEFKSAMENLKSCHHGLVPITVYKVLAMLELPCQGGENSEAGLVATEKPESSIAGIDKCLLYEEIEFDQVIDLLQEIILQFRFVLITSGLPNAEAQNMESEVLVSYEKALTQSEEALKEIERKMNMPKSKLEELPSGKGKMIKESIYISPQ